MFPVHCEANCTRLSAAIIVHTAQDRLRPLRPADQTHVHTHMHARGHVRRGWTHVRRVHTVCMHGVSPPTLCRLCGSRSSRLCLSASTPVFIVSSYRSPTWHGKVERPAIPWIHLAHPSKRRARRMSLREGEEKNWSVIGRTAFAAPNLRLPVGVLSGSASHATPCSAPLLCLSAPGNCVFSVSSSSFHVEVEPSSGKSSASAAPAHACLAAAISYQVHQIISTTPMINK